MGKVESAGAHSLSITTRDGSGVNVLGSYARNDLVCVGDCWSSPRDDLVDDRKDYPRGDLVDDRKDYPRGDLVYDRKDYPRGDLVDDRKDYPRGDLVDDRKDYPRGDLVDDRKDYPRGDLVYDRKDYPRDDLVDDRKDYPRGDLVDDRKDYPRGDLVDDRKDYPRGDLVDDRKDYPRGDLVDERKDYPRGDLVYDRKDYPRGDLVDDQKDYPRGDLVDDRKDYPRDDLVDDRKDYPRGDLVDDRKDYPRGDPFDDCWSYSLCDDGNDRKDYPHDNLVDDCWSYLAKKMYTGVKERKNLRMKQVESKTKSLWRRRPPVITDCMVDHFASISSAELSPDRRKLSAERKDSTNSCDVFYSQQHSLLPRNHFATGCQVQSKSTFHQIPIFVLNSSVVEAPYRCTMERRGEVKRVHRENVGAETFHRRGAYLNNSTHRQCWDFPNYNREDCTHLLYRRECEVSQQYKHYFHSREQANDNYSKHSILHKDVSPQNMGQIGLVEEKSTSTSNQRAEFSQQKVSCSNIPYDHSLSSSHLASHRDAAPQKNEALNSLSSSKKTWGTKESHVEIERGFNCTPRLFSTFKTLYCNVGQNSEAIVRTLHDINMSNMAGGAKADEKKSKGGGDKGKGDKSKVDKGKGDKSKDDKGKGDKSKDDKGKSKSGDKKKIPKGLAALFGIERPKKKRKDRWAKYRPKDNRNLNEDLQLLKVKLGSVAATEAVIDDDDVLEVPLTFTYVIMCIFMLLSAILHMNINDSIQNLLVAVYFVFCLISTIGFGDIVPDKSSYIIELFYSLLGLSVFSITVNATLAYMQGTIDSLKGISKSGLHAN